MGRIYNADSVVLETGLDYFSARYFSAAQGRFTSADLPFANAFDPQSWNLFSYGFNNPLRFVDPTGRCSKNGNGGYTDDGKGEFPGPCVQGNTATATAPKVRDLQAEAQAEMARLQYESMRRMQQQIGPKAEVPLSSSARTVLSHPAITSLPVDCGGGGFVFAGREIDLGPVTTFHGGIVEYDSASGVSKGALVEAGAGEGINGGVGATVTTNQKGQVEVGGLVFGGVVTQNPKARQRESCARRLDDPPPKVRQRRAATPTTFCR